MKLKTMKRLTVSTGNSLLDLVLGIILPFLTSPQVLAVVFNAILQTVKKTQSKAVARQVELTIFQTLGTMNEGDAAFVWPTPASSRKLKRAS